MISRAVLAPVILKALNRNKNVTNIEMKIREEDIFLFSAVLLQVEIISHNL